MTGRFIVFEGPEGGGKSMQVARLAERLRATRPDIVVTREPGGTTVGNEIREILLRTGHDALHPETEVLLLAAARAQHVREVIRPALERGAIVLCDRYVDSTYAYQGGGHGLNLDALKAIQHYATGGLEPGLRVLLDVPVEVGLARRHADPESVNRIDLASREFHERVRDAFRAMAEDDPEHWIVIDAREDPDSVQLHIWCQLKDRLAIA